MRFSLPVFFVLHALIFQTQAASLGRNVEEDDPELGDFFEGDMKISKLRNGIIAENKHWPNGVVPYKINDDFDLDHKVHIRRGMQRIQEVSCVRFRPATDNDVKFIDITGSPSGCHSNIGFEGNRQNLNLEKYPLGEGCFRLGTIMHEMLHALGFFHQQSASDRDDYVIIVKENIIESKLQNFQKLNENTVTDFGIEYDYDSVMHYKSTAFSKNGEETIIPKLGNVQIGQRVDLSNGDIAKLNLMYKCYKPETTVTTSEFETTATTSELETTVTTSEFETTATTSEFETTATTSELETTVTTTELETTVTTSEL